MEAGAGSQAPTSDGRAGPAVRRPLPTPQLAAWWRRQRSPAAGLYLRNAATVVLPLILAALAIVAFSYVSSLATVKSVYRANAERQIDLDVRRLESFFAERQLILAGIARSMTVSQGDLLNNMGKLADNEGQLGGFFEGLYLVDLDGTAQGTRGERIDIAGRPYFTAVARGGNAFSDILVSRVSGSRVVMALLPIRDAFGTVVGALGGAIPIASLLNEVTVAERSGSQAVLLDSEGTLLAGSSLAPDEQRVAASALAQADPAMRQPAEIELAASGETARYLMVQGRLPQLGWRLGLLWPLDAIESGARRDALYGILVSLLLIAAAAGYSLWSTRRFLAPLRQVADGIRALGRGDAPVRAPAVGEDDMARIGAAFNEMAANLAGRERELKEVAVLLERQARGLEIANVQYAEEREAALAASQSKTEFLSNMSHELRTPLNAVLGFSELLAAMPAAASSETVASYAREIHGAGRMLLGHIDSILAYAQLDARSYTPETAATAVLEIVQGAVRLVEQRASSKGLRVRLEIGEPLPPVVTDGAAIRQVLVQLLSNAIKFTAAGGAIRVHVEQPRGRELAIHVQDNGVGIEAEDLDHVFEPFWQAEPALTRSTTGLGLGLAYAKRLIEINGGRLAIESRPGAGTTVTCYLPVTA
ncbi:MAG TPA: sensor histidine kinase [Hypericibacter adhaerens]|jgi:signal transduction histidine kinase|uniref:histidine kinase n=1 Tax=Hypericibacter adhaerens TaxID=2602016 RepID=A0A5J6MSD7_9PROT|nr:sensor histidine kinase [Hypericibacter adhaerens]QEX20488.1 two-component sensor histidine kinase [Hypericibacter adhaerens]HWA46133.1 sensor histidine kinase [Hypericibacter adhaerens]